ncbi:MAG: ROK family protein [Hyphomicrobiaceae bacterium]|nr:ROK family protein [Hyphomicrobiaceae bacterium]
MPPRVGIDLGGTKIAGVVLGSGGAVLAERRIPAPRGDYATTVRTLADLAGDLAQAAGADALPGIGIGMPGSISPRTGLVQNANSVWLNGRPFAQDLEAAMGCPVRLANDANCFALSEAVDGAGAGARSVFGVILGTGCGGGLVFEGRLIDGPRGIGGEWGHNPLPWAGPDEHPGNRCWCGRLGCMETWLSGTGLEADHQRATGLALTAVEIAARAGGGDAAAQASLDRHAGRLARGLAHVVNIFDPHVIVLGGGLSNLPHLYRVVPDLMRPYVFSDAGAVAVLPPRWGDASGVRGAAWLWGGPCMTA